MAKRIDTVLGSFCTMFTSFPIYLAGFSIDIKISSLNASFLIYYLSYKSYSAEHMLFDKTSHNIIMDFLQNLKENNLLLLKPCLHRFYARIRLNHSNHFFLNIYNLFFV